jgi:cellulose synthase/poly-beta-1,6-N-acetylglucosamine synthase-like glycosyltransferase
MPPILPIFSPNYIMYCLGLASSFEPSIQKVEKENLTISAIIPAFNEERNISRTLESLLDQSKKLERVIVVDDASSDRTSKIVEGYKDAILLKNASRLGKAESINRALGQVYSDLVLIVDADTILEQSFIEKAVDAFHEDIVAVSGFVLPDKRSSNNAIRMVRVVEDLYAQSTLKKGQSLLNGLFVVSGCCAVYRTNILRRLGVSSDTVTEDLDLTWSLEKEGLRVWSPLNIYASTIEPSDLREYTAQIRRWYMGFFQCLGKHGSSILVTKSLTFTLSLILIECLLFSIFWMSIMGLSFSIPWLSTEYTALKLFTFTFLGLDLLIVCFPAVINAFRLGLFRDFIVGLPIYYFFRGVNALVWWITFIEWLFGHEESWEKTWIF